MINILLNGACGRMGKEVEKLVSGSDKYTLAAKVDISSTSSDCYTDINDCNVPVDIILDFSNHKGVSALLGYATANKIPTVIATTGHTDSEMALIKEASAEIPIFHSANMSLGVALLVELAVKTAQLMPDADIEIVETHHNQKLDSPSGTALLIANAIKSVRDKSFFCMGRNGSSKRDKNEIGIHSVRRGNIVGIHEVTVSTDSQTITLKHEAHSRALFAEGALSAVSFLSNKQAGLYNMNSIIHQ